MLLTEVRIDGGEPLVLVRTFSPRYLTASRGRFRKVAPNIGDSCEFTVSPAAATRRTGRRESRSQRTERPKVSVWAFGYTRYLTERRRAAKRPA